MGRKLRAAKASLVAAFLAAGGTAAAKAVPAHAAAPASAPSQQVSWGDPLIRFLKLDGFPSYLKVDGFAQLANYYKPQLISDATSLYIKYDKQISDLLDLYQKADAGPLTGILIGLEQWYKEDNAEALLSYIKSDAGLEAYIKFSDFFGALQAVSREEKGGALEFFFKETGIRGVPAVQDLGGGIVPEPS